MRVSIEVDVGTSITVEVLERADAAVIRTGAGDRSTRSAVDVPADRERRPATVPQEGQ